MNYDAALDQAIQRLHDEGRYRTFIDIERRKGSYPQAVCCLLYTSPSPRD